jgi:hypothetical protein
MKRRVTALILGGVLVAAVIVRTGHRSVGKAPAALPVKAAATPAFAMPPPVAAIPVRPAALPPGRQVSSPPSVMVEDITQSLRSGNAFDRNRVFNELLPQLVAASPRDAGLLAEEWAPGPQRDELLREVTRLWTAQDLAGAMTWLAGLADARDQSNAAAAGAAEIARTDPAGAIEVAQIFQAGTRDGSLEHLVQIWTEQDPRAAVDWITARPAGPQRDVLLARVAFVRAQQAPAEAANLALDYLGAGPVRDDAIAAVARAWAVQDPAAAAAWVEDFPAGSLRNRSLLAVIAGSKLH